jgi:hypothetical protein
MLRRVVDIFACWRGLGGSPQCVAMWKLVLACLLLYLWRKINYRCFEDQEWTVADLKSSSKLFTFGQLR